MTNRGPTITLLAVAAFAAVLLTVPVVVYCRYALGFQSATPRVLIHSLLGCLFYGAFTAKMPCSPVVGCPAGPSR